MLINCFFTTEKIYRCLGFSIDFLKLISKFASLLMIFANQGMVTRLLAKKITWDTTVVTQPDSQLKRKFTPLSSQTCWKKVKVITHFWECHFLTILCMIVQNLNWSWNQLFPSIYHYPNFVSKIRINVHSALYFIKNVFFKCFS